MNISVVIPIYNSRDIVEDSVKRKSRNRLKNRKYHAMILYLDNYGGGFRQR